MAMTIGTNAASLTAARSLHESGKAMMTAMERLSTGSRINSAGDDAAGLALSTRMEAYAEGLDVAVNNISNGVAMTTAIETALEEVGEMLVRMKELATQAASDSYSTTDRSLMNSEMISLRSELTAMASRSEFAGQKILDGTYAGKQIQVGAGAGETVAINQASIAADQIGANRIVGNTLVGAGNGDSKGEANYAGAHADMATATHDFEITYNNGGTTTTSDYGTATTTSAKSAATSVNAETTTHGVTATAFTQASLVLVDAGTNVYDITLGIDGTDTAVTQFVSRDDGIAKINSLSGTLGIVASAGTGAEQIILTSATGDDIVVRNANATGNSTMTIQQMSTGAVSGNAIVLANQGTAAEDTGMIRGIITLTSDDAFSTTSGGAKSLVAATSSSLNAVSNASLTTQSNARDAIATFTGAINRVTDMRADLGVVNNRLSHVLDQSIMLRDQTLNAASTITDTNYATESANLAKAQVQQQVGAAMLAQANAAPQLVLQLIQ